MLAKIILPAVTAALVVLVLPARIDAYGAAHVGYTHVGPNGVYHAGATEVARPGVDYRGGVDYRAGYDRVGYGGGAAGGYHYTTGYGGVAGGAAVDTRYAYVR
jgi:hypothetical protein